MLDALGRTIAAATEHGGDCGGGRGGGRNGLEEMHYRRVDKFDGRGSWSDWCFTMAAATHSADKATAEVMDWIEVIPDVMIETLENHTVDSEADSGGSELFDMLVGLTEGEAFTIVRGTQEMNGYITWKRLRERFNPNAPAKALTLVMDPDRPEPDPPSH
jgi:hypothetical protein